MGGGPQNAYRESTVEKGWEPLFYRVVRFTVINKLAILNILAFILTNLASFVTVIFAVLISKEDKFLDGTSLALSPSGLETLCSQSYAANNIAGLACISRRVGYVKFPTGSDRP